MSADPQAPDTNAGPRPADAVRASWVDDAPRTVQPYLRLMRLDRPIGAWLLYWPCVFGLALGAAMRGESVPNVLYLFLTGIGAVVMRGAGCTYNDIVDRDYDARVARTRNRPIPSGVVSVKQAWTFALGLSLVGFVILLSFNAFAILVGAASLFLVACYPFMKRVTWWPQAWLGLTFNWGVPFGFAAATGTLAAPAYYFYAGCFFWTLGYDTIYAHQDREDDALIGVRSTARLFGARTKPMLVLFYALAVLLIGAAGYAAAGGPVFWLGLAAFAAHLGWQIARLDIADPDNCLAVFKSDRDAGLILFAGMALDCASRAWL